MRMHPEGNKGEATIMDLEDKVLSGKEKTFVG